MEGRTRETNLLNFRDGFLRFAEQPGGDVPVNLRVPADLHLILGAHGVGDQIYSCAKTDSAYAWKLKAPDAQLFSSDNQVVAKHFAGPTWEATDKSAVVGKVASAAPAPGGDSIPWLLLTVVKHDGNGVLSPITNIQRLNTNGGKAAALQAATLQLSGKSSECIMKPTISSMAPPRWAVRRR